MGSGEVETSMSSDSRPSSCEEAMGQQEYIDIASCYGVPAGAALVCSLSAERKPRCDLRNQLLGED